MHARTLLGFILTLDSQHTDRIRVDGHEVSLASVRLFRQALCLQRFPSGTSKPGFRRLAMKFQEEGALVYPFLLVLAGVVLACGWLFQSTETPVRDASLEATRESVSLTQTAVAYMFPPSRANVAVGAQDDTLNFVIGPSFDLLFQPKQAHITRPGTAPEALATVWDRATGEEVRPGHTIVPEGGDVYKQNIFERPFNAQTQKTYFPDLDIVYGELAMDDQWVYVILALFGQRPEASSPQGNYGVEMDLDRDGRGDVLVWVQGPVEAQDWTDAGVQVFLDTDNDVGSARVCSSDAPNNGTGYDLRIFYESRGEDPDLAWVKWVSGERPQIHIAFKRALLEGAPQFFWWLWADEGVNRPEAMNYHDGFPFAAAGSPYPDHPYYPARVIARVDNTCRAAFGFIPNPDEVACGACPVDGRRGEPPRDDEKLCPEPKTPPEVSGGQCEWVEDGGFWRCRYPRNFPIVGEATADGEAQATFEVVLIPQFPDSSEEDDPATGRTGRGLVAPGSTLVEAQPPMDAGGWVEVQCAWNPVTCRWDCDDQCVSSLEPLQQACDVLASSPNDPTGNVLFCHQELQFRVDQYTWNSETCAWRRQCIYDDIVVQQFLNTQWDEGAVCEREILDLPEARERLRRLGFALDPAPLPGGGDRPMTLLITCHLGDGDADFFEQGEALTFCVWDAQSCDLVCERKTGMTLGETDCPNGFDLSTLEEICTGYLGQPIPLMGEDTTVSCIVDDGDGRLTAVLPDGRLVPDEGDTHWLYRWNEETCSWEQDTCLWGVACPDETCTAPAPLEGPTFCDGRSPLDQEAGIWVCISYDEAGERLPPAICRWDGCDWWCELYACPEPDTPPLGGLGRSCAPSEEDPSRWMCEVQLPTGEVTAFSCNWNAQVCIWECPNVSVALNCAQDLDPDVLREETERCELRDDGQWRCEGWGVFDACTWDEEECRWRCWDICEVDANGPDGCDQVIYEDNNTWTCLRGSQNFSCTFNTQTSVCDWECDLRCEIPSGPPPQCTYKFRQREPNLWECYDPEGTTLWSYDLASCSWVQE